MEYLFIVLISLVCGLFGGALYPFMLDYWTPPPPVKIPEDRNSGLSRYQDYKEKKK